jgi:peptide/nickel transport system substrate-binding protein
MNRRKAISTVGKVAIGAGVVLVGGGLVYYSSTLQQRPTSPELITQTASSQSSQATQTASSQSSAGVLDFRFAGTHDWVWFDPALQTGESGMTVTMNVYESLFWADLDSNKNLVVKPRLCESYDVSTDGKTYTLHLLKGVKFHDGSEMTAEDVVWSIDRMLRIGSGYSWTIKPYITPGSSTIADPYTVVLNLAKPTFELIPNLTQVWVLNKNLLASKEQPGDFGSEGDYASPWLQAGDQGDVGSGPYLLKERNPGVNVVMEAFPDYREGWNQNQFAIAHLEVIAEEATLKLAVMKGDVDATVSYLDPTTYADLKNAPGVNVIEDASSLAAYALLNCQKAPTDDEHFRRAVAYAFPYDDVTKEIFSGVRSKGPVPPTFAGWNPDVFYFPTDMQKAADEIAQSKYSSSSNTLSIFFEATSQTWERAVLAWSNNLTQLGIKSDVRKTTWTEMVQNVQRPETTNNITCVLYAAPIPTPGAFISGMFAKGAWGTWPGASYYTDPQVEQVVAEVGLESDPAKRTQAYNTAQSIIAESAPAVFVSTLFHDIAFRDYIKGYYYLPIDGRDLYWRNLSAQR